MIFFAWRHAVKQQVAFLHCVKNVLTKSMYMHGFVNIRDSVRVYRKEDKVLALCKRFFSMFGRTNLVDCFERWKHYNYNQVVSNLRAVTAEKQTTDEHMAATVSDIKG